MNEVGKSQGEECSTDRPSAGNCRHPRSPVDVWPAQASSGQDACGAGEAGQVASSEKFSQVVGQRLKQTIYRREDRKCQEAREELSKLLSSYQRSPRYHFAMIRPARIEKPGTDMCWCGHRQRAPPGSRMGTAAGGASQENHLPGLMQMKSHLP